jgi:ribosomal protein L32
MFCKHAWKILSEETTKSRVEVCQESGVLKLSNLCDAVDRKFIQIVTCQKCGKLKRFVEDI